MEEPWLSMKGSQTAFLDCPCNPYNSLQIVDLERGADPFALPEEDSGSDLELNEEELRRAAKRLRLMEKKFADEAQNFLVPEKSGKENYEGDEFEIEGGEDDLEEFEKTFRSKNVCSTSRKKRKSRK